MTLDGCGKPQVIADGLTLLITDGLPMRRPAVHESGSGGRAEVEIASPDFRVGSKTDLTARPR
jgi:hypothetical protein